MSAVSYIQINIFAIILLCILLFHFRKDRADKFLPDQRIFEWMLLSNIIILVFDVGTGIMDGQDFQHAYLINMIVTVAFYAVNPVMGFLYCVFCEIKMETPREKLRKLTAIYAIPSLINLFYCMVNIYTPVFFMIDENNLYNRGPSFWFSFFLSYIIVFYIELKVGYKMYRHGKDSRQTRTYLSLLMFPVAPLIGGALQIVLPGISIIWVSSVISLLIIYINIQNTQMSTDPLTGLFNRGQMMPYLSWKASDKKKKGELYIILLDMDGLKYINDNYGHNAGDEALIAIAEAIKSVAGKNDFVGRYGGDEFIIIAERNNAAEVDKILESINNILETRNRIKLPPDIEYSVSVSGGYTLWNRSYDDIKDFIAVADKRMYQDKKRKRA